MTSTDRRLCLQTLMVAGAAAVLPRPARACEVIAATLRITHPWTRGSAHGATDTPLFVRFDEVHTSDRLIGVSTPIATGARLSGTAPGTPLDLLILAGSVVDLSENGPHIVLTGLTRPIGFGLSFGIEFLFEQAGPVQADLNVDFPAFRFL